MALEGFEHERQELTCQHGAQGRIRDELSTRVVKLADVDTRIENEIGLLRTS